MALKVKFRTLFPALVTAASPLTLVKTGLAYAFGFDIAALRTSLDPVYGIAPSPATVAPLVDGVAAVGTSLLYARQDHVHPIAYPPGAIYGLTLANNVSTPNTVVDIASGKCRDIGDTANMVVASGISKSIASVWAVGTGNGGLDTGTVVLSTWYHVWLIRRSDTGVVDALFSTSATNPTMPTNYDSKRWIGAVKTDASVHFLAFYQVPGTWQFFWKGAVPRDMSAVTITATAALYTQASVPLGIKVRGHFLIVASGTANLIVTDPDIGVPPDTTLSITIAPQWNVFDIWTNNVQQLYIFSNASTPTLNIWTQGWSIPRDGGF